MTFIRSRKFTAVTLVFVLFAGTFLTGFTTQDGIGNVYYETKTEIYDDAYYYEQLAGHSTNGIERAYYINADTQNSNLKPYVFEGSVTGTYTMDTMINTLQSQGYKVVAGVNGDLFDTASGTPKGMTIHDGKIKTSGYAPEYVMSFDQDGACSMEKVNVGYTLKATINVPTYVTTPVVPVTDPALTTTDSGVTTTDPAVTVTPAATTTTIEYIPTEYTAPIGFFNVPHGASKSLHLYNSQYAASTKTSDNSVEVVLTVNSAADAEPVIGGTITATVAQVINGNFNTPIGANQLVLSTTGDSAYAVPLGQMAVGSTVEIAVDDWGGGNLEKSKEAVGVYYVLYNEGQYLSSGTNLNPRTIIGIKPDGSIILYVLDGRQAGFSAGLGLTDTAKHLVDLGCTTVVNMDGGGSSVVAVREAGLDAKAVEKNSPSDGTQRKTTNGLLLVYAGSSNSKAEHLHTYASQPLAMPGADVQLTTYASNENYESLPLPSGVDYSLDDDETGSSVNNTGLFTAGNTVGTVTVEAESDGLNTTTQVDVQNNIAFVTNMQSLVIDPGKSSDVNITAKFGYSPIASKDSLFTWTCDPNIGTIDANGLFQATGASGVSGYISVEYNGVKKSIPVQVGASIVDFADTTAHWAREYIGKLAARGVVNGMGDNCYQPDASLTRAQFLAMLAKTIYGLDTTKTAPTGFADVPAIEWYYSYVNWGFENGIVKGVDDVTFAPNNNITREQMAIMLNNFTTNTDLVLPETNTGMTFTDSALISPWASESVGKIVSSGIMSGYPEGNYNPQGNATRAEAAAVIYKMIIIRDNIAKANR